MKVIDYAVGGILLCALFIATVCYAAIGSMVVPGPGACAGGTPPTIAANDGFTCLFYQNTFTSNSGIDVNNTKAAGFNNYVQNWYELRVTPSSAFSNSGTALTISDTPAAGLAMENAAPVQATAPINTFVGAPFFTAPFYYQADIAVNQALAPGTQKLDTCGIGGGQTLRYNNPIVWFMGKDEVIAQTNGTSPPIDQPEIDVIELSVGCLGQATGTWSPLAAVHFWNAGFNNGCSGGPTLNASWDGATFHTIGIEVLRMADNGGTGFVKFYVSDQSTTVPYMTCTWTSNTSGIGSAETQPMMRMINPGFNWPIIVKNEQFWGLPR